MAFAASASEAAVTGSLGSGGGTLLTLSNAGLNSGSVATLSGGAVLTSDQPFADIPKGGVYGGTFLAAGPTVGQTATLTFVDPVSYLSFLWGSPDLYNVLTITTNMGTQAFSAAGLGFPVTNGDQTFSQYVQFSGLGGDLIKSVSFTNSPATDAFETANFSVAAVPEPATWAMMLIGFGGIGIAMRRSKRRSRALMQIA
jgi:PEP-CTERM motif-containing protein